MLGEAETRVKHAWEGVFRGTDSPPPGTHHFRGFYNHCSGKSHPTRKASGKGDSVLAPPPGSQEVGQVAQACGDAVKRHLGWEGLLLPLPTTSSPLSCPAWEP